jgi:branched-chain amino acid transport system substrate-binding protein
MHYLGAVKKVEGDDAPPVAEAVKAAPIHDVFPANGKLREEGRLTYDRYLMRGKRPSESKGP